MPVSSRPRRATQSLHGVGARPDSWIVSRFHDKECSGAPVTKDDAVTSQAARSEQR